MIGPGSEVCLHFTLRLDDGMVVESTQGEEPLCFVWGDGTLAAGLELALLGLKTGDTQVVKIPPEHAFGFPDPANVYMLARAEFPAGMDVAPGLIIEFGAAEGDELPGTVLAVEGEQVTVDFNHPLAGREVTFEVEIIAVVDPRSPLAGE